MTPTRWAGYGVHLDAARRARAPCSQGRSECGNRRRGRATAEDGVRPGRDLLRLGEDILHGLLASFTGDDLPRESQHQVVAVFATSLRASASSVFR